MNWNNPEVNEDFEKTIKFWLDLGVSGFPKSHPGLGGTHEVNWVAAPQGVARFTLEPNFELIANTTSAEVVVQTTKILLLSSQLDVSIVAGKLALPENCTVWLTN